MADLHRRLFGDGEVTVHKASGRVNLIGEHTDYNDGYVLPTPIDRHICVASSPRSDSRVVTYARDLDDKTEFNLGSMKKSSEHLWSNYVMGVAQKLIEELREEGI